MAFKRQYADILPPCRNGCDYLGNVHKLGRDSIFREPRRKFGKQRPQRRRRTGSNIYGAQVFIKFLHGTDGVLRLKYKLAGIFHRHFACFIQFNAVFAADKQWSAEITFQPLHRPCNGRLGNMKLLSRRRESSAACKSRQLFKIIKIKHIALTIHFMKPVFLIYIVHQQNYDV